jgi:hypothetical protein
VTDFPTIKFTCGNIDRAIQAGEVGIKELVYQTGGGGDKPRATKRSGGVGVPY